MGLRYGIFFPGNLYIWWGKPGFPAGNFLQNLHQERQKLHDDMVAQGIEGPWKLGKKICQQELAGDVHDLISIDIWIYTL